MYKQQRMTDSELTNYNQYDRNFNYPLKAKSNKTLNYCLFSDVLACIPPSYIKKVETLKFDIRGSITWSVLSYYSERDRYLNGYMQFAKSLDNVNKVIVNFCDESPFLQLPNISATKRDKGECDTKSRVIKPHPLILKMIKHIPNVNKLEIRDGNKYNPKIYDRLLTRLIPKLVVLKANFDISFEQDECDCVGDHSILGHCLLRLIYMLGEKMEILHLPNATISSQFIQMLLRLQQQKWIALGQIPESALASTCSQKPQTDDQKHKPFRISRKLRKLIESRDDYLRNQNCNMVCNHFQVDESKLSPEGCKLHPFCLKRVVAQKIVDDNYVECDNVGSLKCGQFQALDISFVN